MVKQPGLSLRGLTVFNENFKVIPVEWDNVSQKTLRLSPTKDKSQAVKLLKILKVEYNKLYQEI